MTNPPISYDSVQSPLPVVRSVVTDVPAEVGVLQPVLGAAFSPLYQQIKTLILHSLQAQEWQPGSVIPSENDLAQRYGVSQGTVRKAIDELASENLLVRRQGKGTFVATHTEQNVQYRFLRLVPDNGDVNSEGPAERQIMECVRSRASTEVAHCLNLRAGETVVQVRRILSFAGVPTILEDVWLPGLPFKGISAAQMANYQGPTYAMYEKEFGVRMVRAVEKLRAICPDGEQAALLKVEQSTPLLSVERIAYTYNAVPMELRRGFYLTDTHHYHNELS